MAPERLIFADTGYWIARLNTEDVLHFVALRQVAGARAQNTVVTSDYILIELLNHVKKWPPHVRLRAIDMAMSMRSGGGPQLVRHSDELLTAAMSLYRDRPDKLWSFTDCTSFVIMGQGGIHEALSADHHFEQAGFTILLK